MTQPSALPVPKLALHAPIVLNWRFGALVLALLLLALQLLGLVIGAIGRALSTPAHPIHLGAGFSASGWLAVVMTSVLARVSAQGSLVRDDLQATV